MKLEMPQSVYLRFTECLPELYPEIGISRISCDETLKKLGFREEAPCVVQFDFGDKEVEEFLDELIQPEIDAYNTEDGEDPPESDPAYQKYVRYGWMWDWFFDAGGERNGRSGSGFDMEY